MNTVTIDIFTLYYSIKYSESWLYYAVFLVVLNYFAVVLFQRKYAAIRNMIHSLKTYLPDYKKNTVALADTGIPQPTTVLTPEAQMYKGEIFRLRDRMETLMKEEKLYQEPELTLADLAKKLQTNSSVLSRVINQCFMLNFNDYINKYRVEDVIAKMSDPKFRNQTLLSIAFDAGFNSKSTFNRAFLKFKETTPRYYYQSLNNEEDETTDDAA
jgi:AraC-like DNA-binding protein